MYLKFSIYINFIIFLFCTYYIMAKSIIKLPTKINFYSITITALILIVSYIVYDTMLTKKEYYKSLKIESMDSMGDTSIQRNINYGNEPEYVNINPLLPHPITTSVRTRNSNNEKDNNNDDNNNNNNHNLYDYMDYGKNRRNNEQSTMDEPLLTKKEFNQFIKNFENKKCSPCPPCARCPEPSFECKKVPNYNVINQSYLPEQVSGHSTYGM
jgi:hypothetical protein